ncbi:hypothetical protein B0H17DRAFT_1096024 [Mycena rosella]|uniref:Uncharacterized protein n=1 Tax=Mycena rosella TaxID=1033263 RepID=A0AAD7G1Z6_MYCRO|nr:hypothetical protein B0H17DRAFT_1096024 [Mycena rosella]
MRGTVWDPKVIEHGILGFDNPRAHVRMRGWCVMFKDLQTVDELLTTAIAYAVPFNIFFRLHQTSCKLLDCT